MTTPVKLSLLGLSLALSACTAARPLLAELDAIDKMIADTRGMQGQACAPIALADAEADAAFARVDLLQARLRQASEHVQRAAAHVDVAYEKSAVCGATDADKDGIPDIIDQCPDDPEDIDQFQDTDGCPDIDPYGDEDGDRIRNVDDDCPDEPEDYDGHNDEDGCPETGDDVDGDGLVADLDQCPDDAEDIDGFQDADGCPDTDNDNDQIPDIRDVCPDEAEDTDDWEDGDGCPDLDNDRDGIADEDDACPNEAASNTENGCPSDDADNDGVADSRDVCPGRPETINAYLDDDGCPDEAPKNVKLTRARIELLMPLQFASGGATLLPAAFPVLDDVLRVMNERPSLVIRVEGHTDADGSDSLNLELSQKRADAVRAYLTKKGIAGKRISSLGLGETRPIDTNRTEAGRMNNRRVEIHILPE